MVPFRKREPLFSATPRNTGGRNRTLISRFVVSGPGPLDDARVMVKGGIEPPPPGFQPGAQTV